MDLGTRMAGLLSLHMVLLLGILMAQQDLMGWTQCFSLGVEITMVTKDPQELQDIVWIHASSTLMSSWQLHFLKHDLI